MSRLRYDMADLSLRMQDEIAELLDQTLEDALRSKHRGRAMATVLYVLHRQTDPNFTVDQAYDMPQRDYEVVNSAESDVPKDGNGVAPPASPVSGG